MHSRYQMPVERIIASERLEATSSLPTSRGPPLGIGAAYAGNKAYYVQLTVSLFPDAYRLIACVGPSTPHSTLVRCSRRRWDEHLAFVAQLRDAIAPAYLQMIGDVIDRAGLPHPVGSPRPTGDKTHWEVLPPVEPTDFRTRAQYITLHNLTPQVYDGREDYLCDYAAERLLPQIRRASATPVGVRALGDTEFLDLTRTRRRSRDTDYDTRFLEREAKQAQRSQPPS